MLGSHEERACKRARYHTITREAESGEDQLELTRQNKKGVTFITSYPRIEAFPFQFSPLSWAQKHTHRVNMRSVVCSSMRARVALCTRAFSTTPASFSSSSSAFTGSPPSLLSCSAARLPSSSPSSSSSSLSAWLATHSHMRYPLPANSLLMAPIGMSSSLFIYIFMHAWTPDVGAYAFT
jgi:hypothetical protein